MPLEVVFIGQAGFVLRMNGYRLILDPYFSDSVRCIRPEYRRLIPVPGEYRANRYDALLLTHCHLDHTDPETIAGLLHTNPNLTVMGPESAFGKLEQAGIRIRSRLTPKPGDVCKAGPFTVTGFRAYHSDPMALGYAVGAAGRTLCFTGDTLWSEALCADIPRDSDMLAVCMNGLGNNMGAAEAAELAARVRTRLAVPVHWGMFSQPGVDPAVFAAEAGARGVPSFIPEPFRPVPV